MPGTRTGPSRFPLKLRHEIGRRDNLIRLELTKRKPPQQSGRAGRPRLDASTVPLPKGRLPAMQPLEAQVKNGRLVLDEPTDLPEGEVIYLVPADDEMTDDE